LAALLVNSTAAIWTPNYTGRILDAVVHSKLDVFWDDVKFYSLLCIVTGAFGAVRNLCVSLVGRRIAKDVREQLFSAMMVQDIAFFDGMPTGQLTSRLTNDTNAMVSPLNTILNSLVSNILLLIGGLVMCLYTSWRLSLLAFTSIGPIIYVTSVYARWYVRYFAVLLVVCTNTRVLFFFLLVIHLASCRHPKLQALTDISSSDLYKCEHELLQLHQLSYNVKGFLYQRYCTEVTFNIAVVSSQIAG
jgi:ABC-type multidrug transport system fused ATPase/permease subunit